jgi:hypothetical protein
MWIRSQNNHILANVYLLRICKCDIDGCVYYSIHGHYDRYEQELGIYSTKEKALKVLDEIQTSIMTEHQSYIEDVNCIGKYFTKEWKEIYQMPQDEEVEL